MNTCGISDYRDQEVNDTENVDLLFHSATIFISLNFNTYCYHFRTGTYLS